MDGSERPVIAEQGFRLEIFFESKNAEFAPKAGLLESTERRKRLIIQAVDEHAAGDNLRGYPVGARAISREHVGMQSIDGVVRQRDRVLFVVIGDHRQYRSEDLLACNGHLIADVTEHRRPDKVAVLQ